MKNKLIFLFFPNFLKFISFFSYFFLFSIKKGEKHFLDSETLNNAPLNNPEHFLYPIKNRGESESESESVATTATTTSTSKTTSRTSRPTGGPTKSQSTKTTSKDTTNINDDNESSDTSDVDSDSSDDYPTEEKDRFVAQLYKFMDDRGTPMNKVPSVNKIDLDLHKFFIVVRKNGGYNKVSKQRKWSEVYKKLALTDMNSANVSNLKSAYERYLQPYEDFYRKLGSTMCDPISHRTTASNHSASKRTDQRGTSHHLFKPRYLSQQQTGGGAKKSGLTTSSASKSADRLTTSVEGSSSASGKLCDVKSSSSSILQDEKSGFLALTEENLTIESLAKSIDLSVVSSASVGVTPIGLNHSGLLSTSIASSDDADRTMLLGAAEDTLTLSGIARNISEDYKKSKKVNKN